MLRIVLLVLVFFPLTSFGNISAKRDKGQDYTEILSQNLSLIESDSAVNASGPFEDLNQESVVEWESIALMQERFEILRDERFIETESGFLRRISWLYPDDGCFARAAKFINLAEEKSFETPQRIFIFGNLNVKTDNNPKGEVSWWYHTAPIVRVDHQVFVLDAAINPLAPMKVEDWILTQVKDLPDAKISYCASHSYTPYSPCEDADSSVDDMADQHQLRYLKYEWSRQESLGRDPHEVLGDEPPWLSDGVLSLL